ncbi:patatin-like protein [Streptomyces sp. NBC_00572]|uniref:patatin-like protein n=1 Tax=Streptomyces sp. NBC_00572 TaxID=2903664 RepID=UPI002256D430|nr:patatin-like protein [Streptomyces sp. NBC_00572]MCX4985282.1 patatin-like protein [Streptomyces sp. NBC_00572]
MTALEQTRLALVLNGGVSLAVWMGGVTHEIDLLRRASRAVHSGIPEHVDPSDRPVFELWERVVREANTHVLVDVIAGTSAGGLNGSLLAAAIGRGTALPNLRRTWRNAAALTDDKLLRNPPHNSVLDGRFFHETISDILHGMDGSERDAEPVTLFVTATALDGLPEDFQDGFGGRFDVADHRRIYKFQHDPDAVVFRKASAPCEIWKTEPQGRRDFLDDKVLDRLSLAARASAGFPLAFAPVDESPLLEQRVRPHPQIPSRGRDRASWIVDGGLLNNAPFGPVLEAISDRHVDGPVRRVLVFVVPSSGVAQRHVENRPPRATEWPSVLGTAINYPREADFRTGTTELRERMGRHSHTRHQDLFERQLDPEKGEAQRATLLTVAEHLFTEYRHSRIVAAVWKIRQLREEGRGVRPLIGIPHEKAEVILETGAPPKGWVPASALALREPSPSPWEWGVHGVERLLWTLVADLEHRLKATRGEGTAPPCDPTQEEAQERQLEDHRLAGGLEELSTCVRDVHAVIDRVFGLLRNAATAGGDPARRKGADRGPLATMNSIYQELGLDRVLGEQVEAALDAYARATAGPGKDPERPDEERRRSVLKACLVAEVVAESFSSPEELVEHTSQFEFLRLGPDAHSPVFPLDKYAPLGERKLYGVRLDHFGAFVDPLWRESDFTWGRLDGAHHLLRLFVAGHQERRSLELELHEAILAGEIGRERMSRNLDELSEPDDKQLFTDYLKTGQGRHTAGRILEAVLSILVGKGSPIHGPWAEAGRTMFWRGFGRKVPPVHWPWPSRLAGLPGRWLWWWRVTKDPAAILQWTVWTAIVSYGVAVMGAVAVAGLIKWLWHDDWGWLMLVLAGLGVALVFLAEFLATVAVSWCTKRWRQRRARRHEKKCAGTERPAGEAG